MSTNEPVKQQDQGIREVTAHSAEYRYLLHLEINPKTLRGLQPPEEALICAVANSTALVDGETVPYAISFRRGAGKNVVEGWYKLTTPIDQEFEDIDSDVDAHLSALEQRFRAYDDAVDTEDWPSP